jgi:hypothetical protein
VTKASRQAENVQLPERMDWKKIYHGNRKLFSIAAGPDLKKVLPSLSFKKTESPCK